MLLHELEDLIFETVGNGPILDHDTLVSEISKESNEPESEVEEVLANLLLSGMLYHDMEFDSYSVELT